MTFDIRMMPTYRLATIRHVGSFHTVGGTFVKLSEIAGAAGLFGPGALMLGVYYDDPETTPVEALRSDAAIVIAPGKPVPEGLVEQQLLGGKHATVTHVGPYEQLGDAWRKLRRDIAADGTHKVMVHAPSYELYRNTPGDVPKEQLITELYMPLA